jgi:hypothetical protein
MNGLLKFALIGGGILSAVLIVSQLVMALLILGDRGNPRLRTMHQHSGYLMVAVSLLYILGSLVVLARVPRKTRS